MRIQDIIYGNNSCMVLNKHKRDVITIVILFVVRSKIDRLFGAKGWTKQCRHTLKFYS